MTWADSERDDPDSLLAAKRAPWTKDQVQVYQATNPPLSVWKVVAVQAVSGVLVALLVWVLFQHKTWGTGAAVSALYGAATVVLPAALMAHGIRSRFSSLNAASAAAGFLIWEMVKLGVTLALLAAAPKLVPQLVWPALLAGLVVAIKVYWLALLWRPRPAK
jgi:ATP synthase protein I